MPSRKRQKLAGPSSRVAAGAAMPLITRSTLPLLSTSISIAVAVPPVGRPAASKVMPVPVTWTRLPAAVTKLHEVAVPAPRAAA